MEIQAVGPFFKNGFVIGCEQTREAVLIDPGDEVARLLAAAGKQSLSIRHILLTHAHIDHITGVDAAKKALDVPVISHHDTCSLRARGRDGGDVRHDGAAGAASRRLPYTGPDGFAAEAVRTARPDTPGGVCLEI
jgi:glyoxylase-like metal-dependent hydrolase (beta-lactamase superfamily II)